MRGRALLLIGIVAVALVTALAVSIFRAGPERMVVSVGVGNYVRHPGRLLANLAFTNHGNTSIAVPLAVRCEVETASGHTNYSVDTRYTIFLHPGQMVVFPGTNYAVPLPPDTTRWDLELRVRPQTGKEALAERLSRWRFVSPRMVSRLAGRPGKPEKVRWTKVEGGPFDVAP